MMILSFHIYEFEYYWEEELSLLSCLFIYSIIYLYHYGLVDVYLWLNIQFCC